MITLIYINESRVIKTKEFSAYQDTQAVTITENYLVVGLIHELKLVDPTTTALNLSFLKPIEVYLMRSSNVDFKVNNVDFRQANIPLKLTDIFLYYSVPVNSLFMQIQSFNRENDNLSLYVNSNYPLSGSNFVLQRPDGWDENLGQVFWGFDEPVMITENGIKPFYIGDVYDQTYRLTDLTTGQSSQEFYVWGISFQNKPWDENPEIYSDELFQFILEGVNVVNGVDHPVVLLTGQINEGYNYLSFVGIDDYQYFRFKNVNRNVYSQKLYKSQW